MPEYRRHRVPGGTYFFTVALADRHSDLLVREIANLRIAVARTRLLHPFQIDAWVVLPEHMHAVWTLPDGDVFGPGSCRKRIILSQASCNQFAVWISRTR